MLLYYGRKLVFRISRRPREQALARGPRVNPRDVGRRPRQDVIFIVRGTVESRFFAGPTWTDGYCLYVIIRLRINLTPVTVRSV